MHKAIWLPYSQMFWVSMSLSCRATVSNHQMSSRRPLWNLFSEVFIESFNSSLQSFHTSSLLELAILPLLHLFWSNLFFPPSFCDVICTHFSVFCVMLYLYVGYKYLSFLLGFFVVFLTINFFVLYFFWHVMCLGGLLGSVLCLIGRFSSVSLGMVLAQHSSVTLN